MQKRPATWKPSKDQLVNAAMVVLILYTMVRSTFRAGLKLFWYDELCTWVVATLPSPSAIWNALLRAADSQAPAFYLLESWMAKLVPNQQIAYRLPSIVAGGITLACLFVWMKRRYSPPVVLVSILIPLLTVFDSTYTVEARAYALVMACLAFALICYDRLPAIGWVVGLAISLAVAESLYYYAIIAMLPFVAAEALYVWKKRTVRWAVWGALACGPLPLLFFWPLLVNFKAYYGQNFWAKPTMTKAFGTFGWLFGMPLDATKTVTTTTVALVVAIAAIGAALYFLAKSFRASQGDPRFLDGLQISAFLLLPIIFFLVTKPTHAGFTERYALPVVLGVTLAAGYGLSCLSKRTLYLVSGLIFLCFLSQELSFWTTYRLARALHGIGQKPIEQLVSAAGHRDLPVMVTAANDFLQLSYYATPTWKARFVSVVDPPGALKYSITDGVDKELQVLRQLKPLNVVDYADFRKKYDAFLVCSIPFRIPWNNDPDWWIVKLQADGYNVTKLRTDGRHSVYLAELPRKAD